MAKEPYDGYPDFLLTSFDWDHQKNLANQRKHGVSFQEAERAFLDPRRVIAEDLKHSSAAERRYFCFCRFGDRVLTVRFTLRAGRVRIFGAGYWTKGRQVYERENQIH